MRVNLIHSILVFQEKKYYSHHSARVNLIHFKLVFLKKNVKKINTLKKKK
jgi:hypothetical protein